jgi:sec-independent protein translocase protein TatA
MFPQSLQTAGLGGLSGTELMVVLGVAVLLFGGKKLGDVGKGLGEGIKNFKSAMKFEDDPPTEKKEEKKEEARAEEIRK